MQIANSLTGSMRIVQRSSLTLRAALRTTPIQIRSFATVAAPVHERLDLPADQPGERRRSLLLSGQGGGIFERDLAMRGPS
jgi:hypothetical protein